jgi:hypothetical protein
MVRNNSKTTAYALLANAQVPTSVEHVAMVSARTAVQALDAAQDLDKELLAKSHREWLEAKLKHRLSKASDKRIRTRMDNRRTQSTAARVALVAAQDTLADGIRGNAAVIKAFLKKSKAKNWHTVHRDPNDVPHNRFHMVPAVKLLVDLIGSPGYCTRAGRCERIGIDTGDHVMGTSINQLFVSDLLEKDDKPVVSTRIDPVFVATLPLKPITPPDEPPSDEGSLFTNDTSGSDSDNGTSSDSDANSSDDTGSESDSDSDSDSGSDSSEGSGNDSDGIPSSAEDGEGSGDDSEEN